MGVNSLPKTVTQQHCGCDLNLGLLRLSPEHKPLGYRATLVGVVKKLHCQRVLLTMRSACHGVIF